MPKAKPVIERFWNLVDKNGPIPEQRPDLGPCWIWKGTRSLKLGYGYFAIPHGVMAEYGFKFRHILAHIFSYVFFKGNIESELQIDHLCRNPRCVNYDHLEKVTLVENVARGMSFSAVNSRKTHCMYGHPLTPDNLVEYELKARGFRRCKLCRRALNLSRKHGMVSFSKVVVQ